MEWTDEAIILGVRRHGESSTIVELMTAAHGRHLGLVRGGASRRVTPILQPGNGVRAVWRARLHEHLGNYAIEGTALRADKLMASAAASYGMQTLAALLRLVPERDPHADLYHALDLVVGHLHEPALAAPLIVRFELQLLRELGFGLNLASCAATGEAGDLVYVSPKSGRAVSRGAGEPWKDQLLALPAFLNGNGADASGDDIASGFALTGFFLERRVFEPRGLALPEARAAFLATIARVTAAA
ncbi:MAG: DNA repair protein RecO [Xanthobacteraceae bacterium]|nr:DNA repair protein RecO [Xanthobacteraceae bacterium]